MLRLILAGLALVAPCSAAQADRATERFAPLQLEMARHSLQRAQAIRGSDAALAASFARQALLDAHIAHRMSESQALQWEAARIADESARLARRLEDGDS